MVPSDFILLGNQLSIRIGVVDWIYRFKLPMKPRYPIAKNVNEIWIGDAGFIGSYAVDGNVAPWQATIMVASQYVIVVFLRA